MKKTILMFIIALFAVGVVNATCPTSMSGTISPCIIDVPGTYALSGDLEVTGPSTVGPNGAIWITASDVTLDCSNYMVDLISEGYDFGILSFGERVTVKNCEIFGITSNSFGAIAVGSDSHDNTIQNSYSHDNFFGISVQGTPSNTIINDNVVESNTKGIYIVSTDSNVLFYGNCLNNTENTDGPTNDYVICTGTNWDYLGEGNFWSDYNAGNPGYPDYDVDCHPTLGNPPSTDHEPGHFDICDLEFTAAGSGTSFIGGGFGGGPSDEAVPELSAIGIGALIISVVAGFLVLKKK